jgi:hypothetical protein
MSRNVSSPDDRGGRDSTSHASKVYSIRSPLLRPRLYDVARLHSVIIAASPDEDASNACARLGRQLHSFHERFSPSPNGQRVAAKYD